MRLGSRSEIESPPIAVAIIYIYREPGINLCAYISVLYIRGYLWRETIRSGGELV